MALGPLLSFNKSEMLLHSNDLKKRAVGLYPDVDDRVCV